MKTKNQTSRKQKSKLGDYINRCVAIVLALAMLNLTWSCSYFNVRNIPVEEGNIKSEIEKLNQTKSYAIIHDTKEQAWHLNNMIINGDDYTISGTIKPISERHIYEERRQSKRVHKYNYSDKDPYNELHLYLTGSSDFKIYDEVTIPFNEIYQISVSDKNSNRPLRDVALWTGGILVGSAIIVLIAFALKSSCPFVYVKNGEEYAFVGELYPGIITPNMQRDDFLPLPYLENEDGIHTVYVTNELKEKQYTDYLGLITIEHDENDEVLSDINGNFYVISKVLGPDEIYVDGQKTTLSSIEAKDAQFYSFDSEATNVSGTRELVLQFSNPSLSQNVNLVLSAKNSLWLDFIYGKFNEQFGSYYHTFQQNQQQVPYDQIEKWLEEQNFPLSIYVKQDNSWVLQENLPSFGPLAMRDIVVPINLNSTEDDVIEIKIETGFMFWDLDYVGLDFSDSKNYKLLETPPISAVDQNGNVVTELLSNVDQDYLLQETIGDIVEVQFSAEPQLKGRKYTHFLKNRGYYNYIRNYSEKPNFPWLKSFREKDAFSKFSETSYVNIQNRMNLENAAHEQL